MEEKKIGISERRWLIREIDSGRMSIGEAKERIDFYSKNPEVLIHNWRRKYAPEISFTFPVMTEKRKTEALLCTQADERIREAVRGRSDEKHRFRNDD